MKRLFPFSFLLKPAPSRSFHTVPQAAKHQSHFYLLLGGWAQLGMGTTAAGMVSLSQAGWGELVFLSAVASVPSLAEPSPSWFWSLPCTVEKAPLAVRRLVGGRRGVVPLSRKEKGGWIFSCFRDLKKIACTGGERGDWEQGVQPPLQCKLLFPPSPSGNPGSTLAHTLSHYSLRIIYSYWKKRGGKCYCYHLP